MSRVFDLVHQRELFCVEEHHSVAEVARKMTELHVGAILVFSGDELRGVFSERDLMKRVVLERRDPERTPVGHVMSTDVATIDESASLEDAMETMQSHNCRHLPVLRGGSGGGLSLHARPHEFRAGAQNRRTPPHAGLHQQRVSIGIIVFGHGSRIESANRTVRSAARDLARAGGYPHVEAAFLELGQPDLEEAADRLVAQGVERIVIIPYFLTLGLHLERDLPRLGRAYLQ